MGGNKYSEAEIVIGALFLLGADGICFLISLTGIGFFIAAAIKGFINIALLWWAMSKGDKNALRFGRVIAKFLINMIPLLPTLTTTFLVETYIHNHPEKFAALEKAAGAASALKVAKTSEK